MKSKVVAYALWVLGSFGCLGFHRFYLRRYGTGILWILTGGVCGIGSIVDLFILAGMVEKYNINVE